MEIINSFGIATFAGIAVIAYLIGMGITVSTLDNKWIPFICGISGAVLGIACLYLGIPDFPATDLINAMAVGIVSGLAATGVDQLFKQLKGGKSVSSSSKESVIVLREKAEEQELKEITAAEAVAKEVEYDA